MSDEELAYKDLIASESNDEDGDLSENEGGEDQLTGQKRIEEMRMRLLGGITKDKPAKKSAGAEGDDFYANESDDDVSDGARDELQVNFGVGFGEDIGKKLIQKKQEKKEKEKQTDFQKW